MSKVKYCIWFVMVWLAMIQSSGKISFLVFEIMIYCFINFLLNRKSKDKKKVKKKYKYENALNENVDSLNKSDIDGFDYDDFEYQLNEVEKQLNERDKRIASYDYREFIGRKDVSWEEVFDYLWIHCRYKGIPMWIEYMRGMVERGEFLADDIKKVIQKAGDYIPWEPRLDYECEDLDFKEGVRKQDKYYDDFFDELDKYDQKMFDEGRISKEMLDFNRSRRFKVDKNHKRIFYYDDYLKEEG